MRKSLRNGGRGSGSRGSKDQDQAALFGISRDTKSEIHSQVLRSALHRPRQMVEDGVADGVLVVRCEPAVGVGEEGPGGDVAPQGMPEAKPPAGAPNGWAPA